jgi:spermidine synthase
MTLAICKLYDFLQTSCRFEIQEFYREVRRILKPTGTFAAWTYNLPVLIAETHPAHLAQLHIYDHILGPYWEPRRRLVEQDYAGKTLQLIKYTNQRR